MAGGRRRHVAESAACQPWGQSLHCCRLPGSLRLLSQDCIHLLCIYYNNVTNEEKKFTGTEFRRSPEVQ
jgi:hypothetical protein